MFSNRGETYEIPPLSYLSQRAVALQMFQTNIWSAKQDRIRLAIKKMADFINKCRYLSPETKSRLHGRIRQV